jgi:hypothetical protein
MSLETSIRPHPGHLSTEATTHHTILRMRPQVDLLQLNSGKLIWPPSLVPILMVHRVKTAFRSPEDLLIPQDTTQAIIQAMELLRVHPRCQVTVLTTLMRHLLVLRPSPIALPPVQATDIPDNPTTKIRTRGTTGKDGNRTTQVTLGVLPLTGIPRAPKVP